VAAAALALLLLLIATFAASPSLHALIHRDANQTNHHCIITVFAHGQVDASVVDVAIVASPVQGTEISLPGIPVFSAVIENLPPGRAPPLSVSFQRV
jgi:hypothetical protein